MTSRRYDQRSRTGGNTLIELIVVLAIVGILAGMTGLVIRVPAKASLVGTAEARVSEARRQAIRTGRPVTISVVSHGNAVGATAYPDGSVVADTLLAIDRLSGRAAP